MRIINVAPDGTVTGNGPVNTSYLSAGQLASSGYGAKGFGGGGGTSTGYQGTTGSGQLGAPQYDYLSTLTPQQQQVNSALSQQITQGIQPNAVYGGQQQNMASALQNALTANPSASLSPDATAQSVRQTVATPLLREYDQSIMPRLKDSYAAAGALMGSRRAFASQQALQSLQANIATQLGNAQLQNQQLSAQLAQQTAQRQGQTVAQQQSSQQGYGQLGLGLSGQQQQAIQPYRTPQQGQQALGMFGQAGQEDSGGFTQGPGGMHKTIGQKVQPTTQPATQPSYNAPFPDNTTGEQGLGSQGYGYPGPSGYAGAPFGQPTDNTTPPPGVEPNAWYGAQFSNPLYGSVQQAGVQGEASGIDFGSILGGLGYDQFAQYTG